MFRTFSRSLVDAVINHPDVRPTMEAGIHILRSVDVLSDTRNVVYACEHGVAVCIWERSGVYKVHIGLLKGGRGKVGLAFAKECVDDLFKRFGASVLHTAIPLQLRAARLFCRLLGFRSTGNDEHQEFFVY